MMVTSAPALRAPWAATWTSFLLNESLRRLPAKARIRGVGIGEPFQLLVPRLQPGHEYVLSAQHSLGQLAGTRGGANETSVASKLGEADLGLRGRHRERVGRHVMANQLQEPVAGVDHAAAEDD